MNIVIVWAGGSWISNLAHIIWDIGYKNIVWIDSQESQITEELKKKWIPMKIGHGKYQVKADDIVIYSEATKDSPEVQNALELKKKEHQPLKIWNYFEFLGELSKYFRTVWIAGTNGKSSSTGLAITVWKKLVPDLGLGIVWALVPDLWNKSYYLADAHKEEFKTLFDFIFSWRKLPYELIKKYYFFLEACEYKRHFLHLDLEYLLITNIELDHTDYYKDMDDYRLAFKQMNQKTKKLTLVLENKNNTVQSDFSGFEKIKEIPITHHNLDNIWWKHVDCNVSLVEWLFKELDPSLTSEKLEEEMKPFRWIWRRLEFLKELPNWVKIFTDYGHIASSLRLWYETMKERFKDNKIICVFQPHQMRRVLTGWDEFKKVLPLFDKTYLYNIYAAREPLEEFQNEKIFKENNLKTVSDLWEYFASQVGAKYFDDYVQLWDEVIGKADENSIIVFFSAWDLDYKLRNSLNLC